MKKDRLDLALYSQVELTDIDNFRYKGWLVRDNHNPKKYAILPLDKDCIFTFSASNIRYVMYLNNGYILK